MAKIVTTIPQSIAPFKFITIDQVMAALPDTIPFMGVIGLSGKIVKGKQTTTLIFQLRSDESVPSEMRLYFSGLISAATNGDFHATVNNAWRDLGLDIMWLYVDGEKILGNDLVYRRMPPPIEMPMEITWDLVRSRLPQTVPFMQTIWATGSIVKNGCSYNDFDTVVGEPKFDENGEVTGFENIEKPQLIIMKRYFETQTNLGVTVFDKIRVDIGNRIMTEREPVYLCKLYENGSLCYAGE